MHLLDFVRMTERESESAILEQYKLFQNAAYIPCRPASEPKLIT